jgi:outer membrane protein assembly factor BamD
LFTTSLLACSSGKNPNAANPVSDYDHEFNEPKKEKAKPLSGPVDLSLEYATLIEAQDAYDKGLYTLSRQLFERLQKENPSSYYTPLVELKLADAYLTIEDYEKAISTYEEFIHLRPQHEAVPYIFMQLGNAHRQQYSGPENEQAPLSRAIERYKKLLDKFPESEYALAARVKIAECREKLAKHEEFVANFYYRQEQWKASAFRYRDLLRDYPETEVAKSVRAELPKLLAQAPAEFNLNDSSRPESNSRQTSSPNLAQASPNRSLDLTHSRRSLDLSHSRVANAAFSQENRQQALQGKPFYAGNLRCEKVGGFDVIEVSFSDAFLASIADERINAGMTKLSSTKKEVFIKFASLNTSLADSLRGERMLIGSTACGTEKISAYLSLSGSIFELSVRRNESTSLSLLQLDRPQRFVLLQRRKTS